MKERKTTYFQPLDIQPARSLEFEVTQCAEKNSHTRLSQTIWMALSFCEVFFQTRTLLESSVEMRHAYNVAINAPKHTKRYYARSLILFTFIEKFYDLCFLYTVLRSQSRLIDEYT